MSSYNTMEAEIGEALILVQMYEALLDAREYLLLNGKTLESVNYVIERYESKFTFTKSTGDSN